MPVGRWVGRAGRDPEAAGTWVRLPPVCIDDPAGTASTEAWGRRVPGRVLAHARGSQEVGLTSEDEQK